MPSWALATLRVLVKRVLALEQALKPEDAKLPNLVSNTNFVQHLQKKKKKKNKKVHWAEVAPIDEKDNETTLNEANDQLFEDVPKDEMDIETLNEPNDQLFFKDSEREWFDEPEEKESFHEESEVDYVDSDSCFCDGDYEDDDTAVRALVDAYRRAPDVEAFRYTLVRPLCMRALAKLQGNAVDTVNYHPALGGCDLHGPLRRRFPASEVAARTAALQQRLAFLFGEMEESVVETTEVVKEVVAPDVAQGAPVNPVAVVAVAVDTALLDANIKSALRLQQLLVKAELCKVDLKLWLDRSFELKRFPGVTQELVMAVNWKLEEQIKEALLRLEPAG